MVRATSARPSGGRPEVPAKMTSSILPPRRLLAPCSPITQARASTTLDLPEPLGPTMQVMPGSSCSVVDDAKDLNPLRVRLFRYNVAPHIDSTATTLRLRGRGDCRRGRAGEVQRGSPYPAPPPIPGSRAGVGHSAAAQPVAQDEQLLPLLVGQGVHAALVDLVEQGIELGLVARDRRRRRRLPGTGHHGALSPGT